MNEEHADKLDRIIELLENIDRIQSEDSTAGVQPIDLLTEEIRDAVVEIRGAVVEIEGAVVEVKGAVRRLGMWFVEVKDAVTVKYAVREMEFAVAGIRINPLEDTAIYLILNTANASGKETINEYTVEWHLID